MGFSSLESKSIVDRLFEHDLLSYGAGHIVYIYATKNRLSIREAGLNILSDHEIKKIAEVLK
jgi:D-ornithine 4,5-aminomutase subunit alpha